MQEKTKTYSNRGFVESTKLDRFLIGQKEDRGKRKDHKSIVVRIWLEDNIIILQTKPYIYGLGL